MSASFTPSRRLPLLTSRWLVGLIILAVSVVLVPASAEAAKAGTIRSNVSSGIAGETVVFTGTIPPKKSRPIVLQRKSGASWVAVASGKTARSGAFSFRTPIRSATTTYRVYAKKVKLGSKKYKAVNTPSRAIATLRQSAALPAPTSAVSGTTVTFTSKFGPARAGRPVELQGLQGSTWIKVAGPVAENPTGVAAFNLKAPTAGNHSYRAIALKGVTGATPFVTSTKTITVTNPIVDGGQDYNAVTVSQYSSCAVTTTGSVDCWGNNDQGQLGDGTNQSTNTPVTVQGIDNATAVDMGGYSSVGGVNACALVSTGGVKCWGNGNAGQLGNGANADSNTPVPVSGITDATAIKIGAEQNGCALLSTGSVKCWGGNDAVNAGSNTPVTVPGITNATTVDIGGQYDRACAVLASGSVTCWWAGRLAGDDPQAPITIPGITTATAVGVGQDSACALLSTGSVKCWGENNDGQLGDGTNTDSDTPVTVSGITTATAIDLGYHRACALLSTGGIRCWGDNDEGQLGNGTKIDSNTPMTVSGITNAMAVQFNEGDDDDHPCALLNTGSIRCWGSNNYGVLGDGTNTDSTTPVAVSGITNATDINIGGSRVCALLSTKKVRCWGDNDAGQLGDGSYRSSNIPQPVAVTVNRSRLPITGATGLSGYENGTCLLMSSGSVKCWGSNQSSRTFEPGSGQVGDGSAPSRDGLYRSQYFAVQVNGLSNATAVATTWSGSSCALLSTGSVRCWGNNEVGQLGDGTNADSNKPVTVSGITNATAIELGDSSACALLSTGSIKCWGNNDQGQLGNGTNTDSNTAVTVSGITNATAVELGSERACALLSTGTVKCWGTAGDETGPPVTVSGLANATAIRLDAWSACALLSTGSVKCWGYNNQGQLGDGTNTDSNTAVTVSGITDATAIEFGHSNACALLSSGSVKCWGSNLHGQLGNASDATDSNVPVTVSQITDARAVRMDGRGSCALLSTGAIKCWGDNEKGVLGDGTNSEYTTTPVTVTGITDATAIHSAGYARCALIASGSVKCWGKAPLGDGTTTSSSVPVTALYRP